MFYENRVSTHRLHSENHSNDTIQRIIESYIRNLYRITENYIQRITFGELKIITARES